MLLEVLLLPLTLCAVFSQNLNIIPDIIRPYVNSVDEVQTLNLLSNISDKLFGLSKFFTTFDPHMVFSEYDFIIVGSGPGGCVLANRLSENPAWSVLLLEAGQPESVVQKVPAFASTSTSADIVWDYTLEPTPGACLNIENQRCVYPVGKALGGSSTVNYLLYVRGNRKDFDKWAQMGNSGWAYDDLLPLFKKIERANIGEYSTDEKYHSREGLLSVEFPQHRSGLSNMFLEAAVQRNISIIDYNGEHQMGMGIIQGTSQNGGRHSAASAYLKPIYLKRDNLHIMPNSLVSRILIDDMKKEAFGVEYYHGGQKHRVYARKEVILSAGPVNSPQLLMLSGVGPKEHLEQLNIPTIVDLPVGEKFYDHIAMLAPTYLVNTTGLSPHVKKIGLLPLLQYVQGKGFLTSYLGIEAVSFHKTPFSPLPPDQPDYEIVFQSTSLQSDLGFGFRKLAKIRTDVYDTLYGPIESPEQDTWSTIILNLHPRSTGSIRLKNNRVQSYPIIRYPFYEDIQDLETLVEGIKEVQRFAETRVMKSIGSSILNIPLPDCMHLEFLSDDYWRCYARHLTFMMVHMVASNKMGPETDAEAVVDPQLRVHGIKHLRVADTSIIPTTISGHTQAISYVIGEKLAIMLKETWQ